MAAGTTCSLENKSTYWTVKKKALGTDNNSNSSFQKKTTVCEIMAENNSNSFFQKKT